MSARAPAIANRIRAGACVAFAATVMVPVSNRGSEPREERCPDHVVGSTSVFIPTALNLTFAFTPTGRSPMSETDTSSKAAPIAPTITCTIPRQPLFSGPEGTATIQGTVTGFFTPR
jgi:hypothetical protein